MGNTMKVTVKTFGPWESNSPEYRALREKLKDRRRFRVYVEYDRHEAFIAGDYTVSDTFLHDNQSTTLEGPRIFDFADYSVPHADHMRFGHYIEDITELEAARTARCKCGYCGYQVDNVKGQWCPKCRGNKYLKSGEEKLLLMLPVNSEAKRNTAPPADVLADIVAQRAAADTARANKAIADKLDSLKEAARNTEYEIAFMKDCIRCGVARDAVENLIYYKHTGKLCFGWRTPLAQHDVNRIRSALHDVRHLYEVEFKQSGE